MSSEKHNPQDFDNLFKEKLAGHSVAPPTGMWDSINSNTAAQKERGGLLWMITKDTSAMIIIVLLFLSSLFGINSFSDTSTAASDSSIENVNATSVEVEESEQRHSSHLKRDEINARLDTENANDRNEDYSDKLATTISKIIRPNETINNGVPKTNYTELNPPETTKTDRKISDSIKNPSQILIEESESNPNNSDFSYSTNSLNEKSQTSFDESGSSNEEFASAKANPRTSQIENEEVGLNAPDESDDSPLSENDKLSEVDQPVQADLALNNASSFSGYMLLKPIFPFLISTELSDTLKSAPNDARIGQDIVGKKAHEIYAGVHANFNLPIIFNQNTHGVFEGKELAYQPTFGLASGVRLGYTYKRHYGFETGFIFFSQQGQKYNDKIGGVAARRQVQLHYFHIPFMFRYKFKIKKQQKFESPWVINFGGDVGILQSANISYEGNEFELTPIPNQPASDKDFFKPTDISVVLGVEKEIYFTNWLMMSVGVRTTFSGDINADEFPVINDGSSYDQSHNFTFGFTLGLNYYMRR